MRRDEIEDSKPHIFDAARIPRQVLEFVETVEVIDRQVGDGPWFGQAQVDGKSSFPVCPGLDVPVCGDAAAD